MSAMTMKPPTAWLNALSTATPDHDIHQAFIDWATQRLADERVRAIFLAHTGPAVS